MPRVINIYLDDESNTILNNIKKKNSDFNISSFVQSKLRKVEENEEDVNIISLQIEKKKSQINELKVEVDILEDKKFKIETKKKMDEEEKQKEKIKEERKKEEFIKRYSDNLSTFFEIDKEDAILFAEENYNKPLNDRLNIFKDGEIRGLKPKAKKE